MEQPPGELLRRRRDRPPRQRAVHRRLCLCQPGEAAQQGRVQPRQPSRSDPAAGLALGQLQSRRLRARIRLGRDCRSRTGHGSPKIPLPLAGGVRGGPEGRRSRPPAPASSRERRGRRMIIAVDGPTASGKGTIARALAAHFGLAHLDTGLLYRAVGRQVFLDGGDPDSAGDALAACTFADALLTDPELRSEATGGLASRVSVHAPVREALYERQRSFALQQGGAVLDGRDIGTVIAPDAEVKLFVTASVEARAQRRWKEMQARGEGQTLAEIEADLRRRDERDRTRAEAPLRIAEDAIVLDTSDLAPDAAIAAAIAAVEQRRRAP